MTGSTLISFGLLLAALTSVCNVLADVSRKKVVDRHELIASTFWIRVFAALVCAIALLGYALSGSPPVIHAPATLSRQDIKDLPSLAAKLKQGADGVSQFIMSRMSTNHEAMAALTGYAGANSDPAPLLAALTDTLTPITKGKAIYEEARFAGVKLSAETQKIMGGKPRGETLTYLNRLLLEDAFPKELPLSRKCALFGLAGVQVAPMTAFLVYLAIDVAFIALAQILLMAALKVSPMSLCIPFMAFSPVFLVLTGYVILNQMPKPIQLLAVGLIVVGSLVMNRSLFATGWTAPIRAIIKERGSRYVLSVALILAFTVPIERQLVFLCDPMTQGFSYCVGLVVFFGVLAWFRRADCGIVMRKTAYWAILAGVLDATALILMYYTISYIAAVIAISIKRAGIVLAIGAGWLFFKERGITDKLIAASVMLGGVLIFYLPLTNLQAGLLAGAVLVGMALALVVTHKPAVAATVPQSTVAEAKKH